MAETPLREIKIQPIKNGTVIDHIKAGSALRVMRILDIPKENSSSPIAIGINVDSKHIGKKDILKIEDRELDASEVHKIALIAPSATISIIRNYEVVEKYQVKLPDEIEGIVKCTNPSCISNSREPIKSKFRVISDKKPCIRCVFCDRELSGKEIESQIV